MNKSSIEWCDITWNVVRGCTRVSPGCVNCYAERLSARNLPGLRSPTTGEPFAEMTKGGPRWTGAVEFLPHKLAEPLSWKKSARVFVNSMSDLFHEDLTNEQIAAVFGVMAACPHLTFQVLTKRPERAAEWFAWVQRVGQDLTGMDYRLEMLAHEAGKHVDEPAIPPEAAWPLPNVWLGVSVEDRERKARIDTLREIPAALRFLSLEPLLEDLGELDLTGIGWAIAGGESGPGARPFDVEWARSTIQQCREAGVPVFVKQLGANRMEGGLTDPGHTASLDRVRDRKGGAMSEWPEDLRVREFPEAPHA